VIETIPHHGDRAVRLPRPVNRRTFLQGAAAGITTLGLGGPAVMAQPPKRDFKISLAGWSLHKEVFSGAKTQLDLFEMTREEFGIDAFELVNRMLDVPTLSYVQALKRRAEKFEIEIPLIMVDGEGALGAEEAAERDQAVRYHAKWLDVAADLGCHSIRVNWAGGRAGLENDPAAAADFIERSAGAYERLCDRAAQLGLNVLIENHWGASSYPDLLLGLMSRVGRENFGTLPDFGNFPKEVDRYDAVDRMMPHAKAVSAKCHDFDAEGRETKIDFDRMLEIVADEHGYRGWIGIEYEGRRLSEPEGILACKSLLERLRG
jgi:sugar phosphate isomerase/epimerase